MTSTSVQYGTEVFKHTCRKLVDTPFPFSWTQAASLMILAMVILVPFISTAYSASLVLATISSFLVTHLFVTLHQLAASLEHPFKQSGNQDDFTLLQKRFNERVLATAFSERPIAFNAGSEIDSPGHMPVMHDRYASHGPGRELSDAAAECPEDDLRRDTTDNAPSHDASYLTLSVENQGFSSEGQDSTHHHMTAQAQVLHSFAEGHEGQPLAKEACIQHLSEMSWASSRSSGSLDRTMHEPLQFGFDKDDGGLGGNRDNVPTGSPGASGFAASTSGRALPAESTKDATQSYGSPASMHGLHTSEVVVTLQGSRKSPVCSRDATGGADWLASHVAKRSPRRRPASSPLAPSRQQWTEHAVRQGRQHAMSEDEQPLGLHKLGAEQLGTEVVSMRLREQSDRFLSEVEVATSGTVHLRQEHPAMHALVEVSSDCKRQVLLLLLLLLALVQVS